MPDNQRICSPKIAARPTWSLESLNSDIQQKTVIRKFINSAVYVEKSVMPPLRKKSSIVTNSYSDGESTIRSCMSDRSVKLCTCVSSPESCQCHSPINLEPKYIKSEQVSDASTTSSSSSDGSKVTVKSKEINSNVASEFRLSLDLPTDRTSNLTPQEKEEIIKHWLKKKDEEKKKRESYEARIKEMKKKERELLIEKERESFKRWLAKKKLEEEKIRQEKEKEEQEKKLKEEEQEQRMKENQDKFNQWLRKKKRSELERKIKEKLALLQLFEEKQKRMEENERAYHDWLTHSKNKPKPVPLNQGLKSLCSSTSVTYINPIPWISNLELAKKPVSQ